MWIRFQIIVKRNKRSSNTLFPINNWTTALTTHTRPFGNWICYKIFRILCQIAKRGTDETNIIKKAIRIITLIRNILRQRKITINNFWI